MCSTPASFAKFMKSKSGLFSAKAQDALRRVQSFSGLEQQKQIDPSIQGSYEDEGVAGGVITEYALALQDDLAFAVTGDTAARDVVAVLESFYNYVQGFIFPLAFNAFPNPVA